MAACTRPRGLLPSHVDAVLVRFSTAPSDEAAVSYGATGSGGSVGIVANNKEEEEVDGAGANVNGHTVGGRRRRKRKTLHPNMGPDPSASGRCGIKRGAAANMFSVLGPLCRWRACLAEQTRIPPPRSLCYQHSALRAYLESLPGGGQVIVLFQ